MLDLRMPLLGGAAWAGAIIGGLDPRAWALATPFAATGLLIAWRRRPDAAPLLVALALAVLASVSVTAVREQQVVHGPVARLADRGATVTVVGAVASDPVPLPRPTVTRSSGD